MSNRRLLTYICIDTSGSMRGEPIEAVNSGLHALMSSLRQNPYALESVHLSITTFDSQIQTVLPLTPLEQVVLPEIVCPESGATFLGGVLEHIVQAVKQDRIVGNNMYPNMTETLLETRAEDTAALKVQRTKDIEAYLSDIDTKHRDEALAAFKADGCVDHGIASALAGATIAELTAALTEGKGAAEKVAAIAPHRWSERFETLRQRTEDYKAAKNDNVKIFLANMGPIPQHKARADFTTGFLQVGAFEVLGNDGFKTVEEAAEAAGKSGADAVVICSTDATYPEIVPALAPKLHEVLPNARVFLAGAAPKDLLETYNNAGIDEYISVKANCYETLERLQKKKGMIA